ncbi:hypothetical protein [Marinagarivorans cellulosilyticus]|uniref:Uncharacterized protein n=1 Tax=Marinagarivorans cellulosilyticus TaxID=2721545 RepID=A0AAN2BK25_9GAMM|nr:hypothetical protein [Marinagarivorans cellulosilyticus]BCD97561.1 hypothetical protein MARGE09_P1762 [Marinagarivorans cellulosilyticus]
MTERREPTLSASNLSDQAVLDEPQAIASKASSRKTARPAPVSQRVVEVKSPLAPLALVASIVSLGFVGLLFWQVTTLDDERKNLIQQLGSADARIAELEQKLTVTGDASEQSLTTLGAGVKTLDADVKENSSEIRKLWGVAYDRNRKAIEENKKTVETVEKAVANLKAAQQKDQKALQAAIADLQGELAVLSEVQESQQSALSQSRNISAQLQALKTDLSSRVNANEEAIKAIDAFRLQVNRQILQMGGTANP